MRKTLNRYAAVLALTAIMASVAWAGATPAMAAAPPAPGTPVVASGTTTTDGTVVLVWAAPSSGTIAYYEIFRKNGAGTAAADDVTYVDKTATNTTQYIDQVPTEGTYQYSIIAIDQDGNASPASAWTAVTFDNPSNGTGNVVPDITAPAIPTNVRTASAYSKSRSVVLNWNAVTGADLWRYLVYRTKGTETTMVGYVAAGTNTFTDVLTEDGNFMYTVKAQDTTGNLSGASANASVIVDTVAPVVQITSPVVGQTYPASGALAIAASFVENGSGYSAGEIKYYLDGTLLSTPVITLNNMAAGAHTAKVELTDRAGNTGSAQAQFIVNAVVVDPAAPRSLTAPAFSKSRTVTLTWQAPQTGTVSQYLVYRSSTGGTPTLIGTTMPNVLTYADTVTADGVYTYYVNALAGSTITPNSNTIAVTVDTVVPAITVTAPQNGHTYAKTGTLTVQHSITDVGGYDPAQVKLFLDGTAFTGTQINLANLATGNHTFKVDVTDRAGNAASKSVQFSVNTTGTGDNNGDDDEDEDHGQPNGHLIEVLKSVESKIHHGHYVSLMAMAKAGKIRQFTLTVIKFRGKFIAPDAADKLLEAVGAQDLNINPNSIKDSDIEGWNQPGNGKGKGGK